ncbi:MAG: cupin domain-containing protein [Parasphingorhabdus sp.]
MLKLENFDAKTFLRDYWQKKPLFIKNPWNEWHNPLEPDELAGLACEDDIESRLVIQVDDDWKVELGPLAESRFSDLGNKRWTLLVQAVDHHVSQVAALIQPFRFIPDWRIDDVMVSYAAEDGGVGPHFDQYDVFLIQGLGKRRWQIGSACDENSKLISNDQLKLLAEFEASDEWVCEPGDILYIPPGLSHNGVALGQDCMTYSIGFRAPSQSELLSHWVDELPAILDDDRYGDPDLRLQDNPGEILPKALNRMHDMIKASSADRDNFIEWFGLYNSALKYPDIDWSPEKSISVDDLLCTLETDQVLMKNPASRCSFIRQGSDLVLLFVDGQMFECKNASKHLAEQLCASGKICQPAENAFSAEAISLLTQLYNQGSLYLDQDQ